MIKRAEKYGIPWVYVSSEWHHTSIASCNKDKLIELVKPPYANTLVDVVQKSLQLIESSEPFGPRPREKRFRLSFGRFFRKIPPRERKERDTPTEEVHENEATALMMASTQRADRETKIDYCISYVLSCFTHWSRSSRKWLVWGRRVSHRMIVLHGVTLISSRRVLEGPGSGFKLPEQRAVKMLIRPSLRYRHFLEYRRASTGKLFSFLLAQGEH